MNSRWRTIPGFVRIGSTGKARGIEGEIKLYVDDQYLEDVIEAEFLFLERDGNKVPLAISSIREVQDLLVKFDEINDPTAANNWTNLEVFLPDDEIESRDPDNQQAELHFQGLKNFTIIDSSLGHIGLILEVRDYPQQEMAVIRHTGREVLIPLNSEFIDEINEEKKTVSMNLPEGLLGL